MNTWHDLVTYTFLYVWSLFYLGRGRFTVAAFVGLKAEKMGDISKLFFCINIWGEWASLLDMLWPLNISNNEGLSDSLDVIFIDFLVGVASTFFMIKEEDDVANNEGGSRFSLFTCIQRERARAYHILHFYQQNIKIIIVRSEHIPCYHFFRGESY